MYFYLVSYPVLGAGLKYIDDAFDEKIFNRKFALILAPFLGALWAYTMFINQFSATILLAILIGVFLRGKVDNHAHFVGLFIIIGSIILVGINLLREGLDLPEVALVAILDADKEGFLRSETALIQTIGRTARHVDGKVIMYADRITDSMQKAIVETNRRRLKQLQFNEEHGITPRGIVKPIMSTLRDETKPPKDQPTVPDLEEISDLDEFITQLEKEMKEAERSSTSR